MNHSADFSKVQMLREKKVIQVKCCKRKMHPYTGNLTACLMQGSDLNPSSKVNKQERQEICPY